MIKVHIIDHILLGKLLLFLNMVLDPAEGVSIGGRLLMVVNSSACCCCHNLVLLLELVLIDYSWHILTKLCLMLWVILGHVCAYYLLSAAHLMLYVVLNNLIEWVLRAIP